MALTLRVRPDSASRVGSGESDGSGAGTIIKQKKNKDVEYLLSSRQRIDSAANGQNQKDAAFDKHYDVARTLG